MSGDVSPINNLTPISSTDSNIQATVDIENINSIFATDKREGERTTFDLTFWEMSLNDSQAQQASQFMEGLVSNKEALMADLGLEEEEYDALCIIALALASQETGMGLESGYVAENTIYEDIRLNAIYVKDRLSNSGSASSGLTQMKINDFVNFAYDNDAEQYARFQKYGIETQGTSINNLFEEPDKAAVATIIVLSHMAENDYNVYLSALSEGVNNDERNDHTNIAQRLNDSLSEEERTEKGQEILNSLQGAYETLSSNQQEELRKLLKNWVLSHDGTNDVWEYRIEYPKDVGLEFLESKNLERLNKILKNAGFQLEQSDLDYIRYTLTDKSQAMTMVEYMAYAWNNGTGYNGMQVDRLVAEKITMLFTIAENFSNNQQFSINVEELTERYANKANASLDDINYLLEEFNRTEE